MTTIAELSAVRAYEPERFAQALAGRQQPGPVIPGSKMLVLAVDHPARGALGVGDDPGAMASRQKLLERCVQILSDTRVGGFLGTADLVEDLAVLGVLDNKRVWGSMNRGGIQGASFEMDDRFTGYSAQAINTAGLQGGKMLVRIDPDDPASVRTLQSAATAIDQLAERDLGAMVEPFMTRRVGGRSENDLDPAAVIRSIAIAQGLGGSSARTWLKLPCVENMEEVMASTTLPSLLLGGEVQADPTATYEQWQAALELPNVVGLVIGRSLLFPADGDVEGAVSNLVEML